MILEYQRQDNQISPIIEYVEKKSKPPKKFTYQIRSKLARNLALQWDRLILKQGVLHQLYIFNEIKYHQFVLPQRYHRKVLKALHDNMGHQGIDRTMDLLRERVYWPSMAKDAQSWVMGCCHCQIARLIYTALHESGVGVPLFHPRVVGVYLCFLPSMCREV